MTIEERAIKASLKHQKTYKCYDDANDKEGVCYFTKSKSECEASYIQGAIEQKKIDIEKACNLLHDLLIEEDETYLGNAGILKDKIDKFRKAMEE